jgi:N-dimethylarginine dimethylaminohydrolase
MPIAGKRFVLANLLPTRAGESAIYRDVLERIGFRTVAIASRFEGEADFFPVGDDLYLFTFGVVERQRFVPRWGLPPWRRRYGFRTDRAAADELAALVHAAGGGVAKAMPREVLPLELGDEAFYHGDTCLAAFGPSRRFVLAVLPALAPASRERLLARLGDRVVPLSEEDAAIYAANGFRLAVDGRETLFLPAGVSERLQSEIRERGVEPVTVDVSEFWKKGGGSVKCMIADLGPLDPPATAAVAAERTRARYDGSIPI